MTDIEAAVREAILDAVRAGLGHAILLIDEYGADNPDPPQRRTGRRVNTAGCAARATWPTPPARVSSML